MPELSLVCVGGPLDGQRIAVSLPECRVYTFDQPAGVSLRYVRDGMRLYFDWLSVESEYVEQGLAQLADYVAERVAA